MRKVSDELWNNVSLFWSIPPSVKIKRLFFSCYSSAYVSNEEKASAFVILHLELSNWKFKNILSYYYEI
jgi:hypothetical protein